MRFNRQLFEALTVPCKADGLRIGVLFEPAVIMAAALPQTFAALSKADQGYEQYVGDQIFSISDRLAKTIGAPFQVAFAIGISVLCKMHQFIGSIKTRQGNAVAAILKETGIGRRRCFLWCRVIEPDYGVIRDLFKQRSRGVPKDKPAHHIGQGRDVFAAELAEFFAECGFVQRFRTYSFDLPERRLPTQDDVIARMTLRSSSEAIGG